MGTQARQSRWRESPRVAFGRRFADLYTAAGNPTLRRVAAAAEVRMRAARGRGRPGGVAVQRISDWKTGRTLPARFDSFLPVLLTLIDEARKSSDPAPPALLDTREWERLWTAANAWNPDDADAPCPYPGLTAYTADDADVFFGRSRPTAELAELVRATLAPAGDGGVVVVVGASGAGKSSLLHAGLVPALGSDPARSWVTRTVTPGIEPVAALHAVLDQAEWAAGTTRLLIVDQTEELFTQCDDDRQRDEFLAALAHLAVPHDDDPATAVVVALRADFYGRCLDYAVLENALKHRCYLLGPMRLDELAEAVTHPAEAVGYRLEAGLEELVVSELCGLRGRTDHGGYDPGALPLLSHVMAAAWRGRVGGRLTIDGYRQAGGVLGSVAATAEKAWHELTEIQQAVGKHLLLGLVTVGQDTRDTRRKVSRADLVRRSVEAAEAALEALARCRLVTLDAPEVGDPVAYLTHEIVLDAWPRLRAWIDEDRVGYLERQRMQADAAEWVAADRDTSRLYRGARLAAVEEHLGDSEIGPEAAEFLHAARSARARTRRRGHLVRAVVATLGIAVLLLAGVAVVQRGSADRQRDDAIYASILTAADGVRDRDPSVSAQLDLVAAQHRPHDADTLIRLWNTQNTPLATVLPDSRNFPIVAYQPGTHLLAAGADSGVGVRFWDVSDVSRPRIVATAPLPDRKDGVVALTFSPDGHVMATYQVSSSVTLWDTRDAAHPRPFGPPIKTGTCSQYYNSSQATVSVSSDGTLLAVPTCAAGVQLWNIANPAAPVPAGVVPVFAQYDSPGPVQFAPTGAILAIARQSTVELWDVADPAQPAQQGTASQSDLAATGSSISTMAFRPDGKALATGSSGGPVYLWNVADPHALRLVTSVQNARPAAVEVAFSPDGSSMVTADWRGTAELWNVGDSLMPTAFGDPLVTETSSYWESVAFGPDGRTLATSGGGGPIRLWSVPPSGRGPTVNMSFSADGRLMAGSYRGISGLWDIGDLTAPRLLSAIPGYHKFTLSPDGRTLVAQSAVPDVPAVQVFDTSNPSAPTLLPPLPTGGDTCGATLVSSAYLGSFAFGESSETVAFSPDSKLLAMMCGRQPNQPAFVRLWDIADRAAPAPMGVVRGDFTPPTFPMVFSPDSTVLLTASESATLWNVAKPGTPQRLASLPGVAHAVFSRDGRTLVTAGAHGDLTVWDLSNRVAPKAVGTLSTSGRSAVGPIDISSDGKLLVAGGGSESALYLWDFTDPRHPVAFGRALGADSAGSTGVKFVPSRNYLASTTFDGDQLQLWNLDPDAARARVCAATTGALTPEVWRKYLPGLSYRPPCG